MQKIIFIAAVCCTIITIGCKKNDSQNNTPTFTSYLRFKLNNVPIECNALITATYFSPSLVPDTLITISGSGNDVDIALFIHKGQGLSPGIYVFNSAKWHSGTVWTKNPAMRYVAGADLLLSSFNGSGQVTITEVSTQYVKGSFDFITAIDTATHTFKTITNGEFNIKRN